MTENKIELITYRKIAEQLIGAITINIAGVSINQEEAIKEVYGLVKKARIIITTGKGRSGYIAQFFAQRLSHILEIGKVWFIDDSTTPSISEDCLVIMVTGSGETRSQIEIAKEVKEIGAKLVVATSKPKSTIGKLADVLILISGRNTKESESVLPLGTGFELAALVVLEALNGYIIKKDKVPPEKLKNSHRNLE